MKFETKKLGTKL